MFLFTVFPYTIRVSENLREETASMEVAPRTFRDERADTYGFERTPEFHSIEVSMCQGSLYYTMYEREKPDHQVYEELPAAGKLKAGL